MSFGSLEVASIPRTQDYTTMKQNEDNKGAFQQIRWESMHRNRVNSGPEKCTAVIMQTGIRGSMMPRKKERMSMPVTVVNTGKKKIPKKMVWW